jgi:hypothetical protein
MQTISQCWADQPTFLWTLPATTRCTVPFFYIYTTSTLLKKKEYVPYSANYSTTTTDLVVLPFLLSHEGWRRQVGQGNRFFSFFSSFHDFLLLTIGASVRL